jgi:hypothetical protein
LLKGSEKFFRFPWLSQAKGGDLPPETYKARRVPGFVFSGRDRIKSIQSLKGSALN